MVYSLCMACQVIYYEATEVQKCQVILVYTLSFCVKFRFSEAQMCQILQLSFYNEWLIFPHLTHLLMHTDT